MANCALIYSSFFSMLWNVDKEFNLFASLIRVQERLLKMWMQTKYLINVRLPQFISAHSDLCILMKNPVIISRMSMLHTDWKTTNWRKMKKTETIRIVDLREPGFLILKCTREQRFQLYIYRKFTHSETFYTVNGKMKPR